MNRFLKIFFLLLILVLLPYPEAAFSQAPISNSGEPYSGLPVCLPGVFLQQPENCLPMGPSAYLSDMAQKGIILPLRPLPAVTPDPALTKMPATYARVNLDANEQVPIYGSLDDAKAGVNPVRFVAAGRLRYLSIVSSLGKYVQLKSGEWVRAAPIAYSKFQGLEFRLTPRNSFGWVVENSGSRRAPDYNAPLTGKKYFQMDVLQVYDTQKVKGMDWFMVGVDEWIDFQNFRPVIINTVPPQGVTGNRWIEVNLYSQTLSVYEGGSLKFAALIATGVEPFYTRPGVFKIYKKKELETMSGAFEANRSDFYYLEDVPWTMYYDEARALHGAYWRTRFGFPQSHGCVNLSAGDSHWLYDWAKEGDPVYVWDPSGKTPVDPKNYGPGGA
jgi:hypothetical protein